MSLLSKILGNATPQDIEKATEELAPILIEGETVQIAFKFVRDQVIFTDLRLITIDREGMSISRVRYRLIPYRKIASFSAETSGLFDLDAELELHLTGNSDAVRISLKGNIPIREVYRVLSHFVLERQG